MKFCFCFEMWADSNRIAESVFKIAVFVPLCLAVGCESGFVEDGRTDGVRIKRAPSSIIVENYPRRFESNRRIAGSIHYSRKWLPVCVHFFSIFYVAHQGHHFQFLDFFVRCFCCLVNFVVFGVFWWVPGDRSDFSVFFGVVSTPGDLKTAQIR